MSKDDRVEVTQADRQVARAIYGFIRRELDDSAYRVAAAHRLAATPPSPPAMGEVADMCERLRQKEDSGQRTLGSGWIGSDGKGGMSGGEKIMRLRNPDGPAAADLLASLTVPEPDKEVLERVARVAYLEALTAGWNSGMARETMDADYAERSWLASDAAAAIRALKEHNHVEG
jgi:hypothetical protein